MTENNRHLKRTAAHASRGSLLSALQLQPVSLRHWVLNGFLLALIPLSLVLWQGHSVLEQINSRSLLESRLAVEQARRIENTENLITDIERSVRQHDILGTDSTARVAHNHLENYRTHLESLCEGQTLQLSTGLCEAQARHIDILHGSLPGVSGAELDNLLEDLRSHQSRLTSMIWSRMDQRLQQQQEDAEHSLQRLAWQTAALVGLTLGIVIWSSRRIARPIQRLHDRIQAIGRHEGLNGVHSSPHGPKELQTLDHQLDWLAYRLQQLEALRLAFLRHASHEFKTPLASLKEGWALLTDEVSGPLNHRQRDILRLVGDSTDRLGLLTDQLLEYNRLLQRGEARLRTTDPLSVIHAALENHQLGLEQRQQTVEVHCEIEQLQTDRELLQRMLDNLLSNARAYGHQGGRIRVELISTDSGGCRLSVANDGPELSAEDQKRLFEPFQRGRFKRQDGLSSSGLGLSIVADCARLLGGTVNFTGHPDFDVCVEVHLPATGRGSP